MSDRKAPTPPPGDPDYAGLPQVRPDPPPAPPSTSRVSPSDMKDAGIVCGRCGCRKGEHHLVNFVDGPFVGEAALVCPTSVFRDRMSRAAAAAARAEDSR